MFHFKLSFDCNVKDLKDKPLFKLVIFDHKALLFSRIDRWEINLGDWFINEFDKKKGTDR